MKELPFGVAVGELAYPGRRQVADHAHQRPFFCLLLAGSYEEQLGRRRIAYTPLTVAYHPAGVSHREEIGPGGARLFGVRLGSAFMRRLVDAPLARGVFVESRGRDLAWLAGRLHREWTRPDGCSLLAMEGLLLEMLAEVSRSERAPSATDAVRKAIDLLHARYDERLTLGEVARAVDCPPAVLARAFRRAEGASLAAYQRRLRVQAACRELAAPERSLTDVAALTGFADQSHLSRVFRRFTGFTPGAFRKLLGSS